MPLAVRRSLADLLLLAGVVCALLSAAPRVAGSALTTTINANERTCFYAAVDKVGEKVRQVATLQQLCARC